MRRSHWLAAGAGLGLLGVQGLVLAATPTRSDIEACNAEARTAMRGSMPGSQGGSAPGRVDPTPSAPTATGTLGQPGSSLSRPLDSALSGTVGPRDSPQGLGGLATDGRGNVSFEQAFRQCMTRRGFSG